MSDSSLLEGINLFLSYTSDNKGIADLIRGQLQQRGARIWVDYESLKVGVNFRDKIREAIKGSDGFVTLLTPDYQTSFWPSVEFAAAWLEDLPIYPVLHGVEPRDFEFREVHCCRLEDIESKLIPSLATLAELKRKERKDIVSPRQIMKVSGSALDKAQKTKSLRLEDYQRTKILQLIAHALSMRKSDRKLAHKDIQKLPPELLDLVVCAFLELAISHLDHIRAEAYYFLGSIHLPMGEYARGEDFIRRGLYDSSLRVMACSANVLSNFKPLRPETKQRLRDTVRLAAELLDSDPNARALYFWAKDTLGDVEV